MGWCVLKADSLLINGQQQQNPPPGQEPGILQQEHQSGILAVVMYQGGKLSDRGEREESFFMHIYYIHAYLFSLKLNTTTKLCVTC